MARVHIRAARVGTATGGDGDGTERGDAERWDDARQARQGRLSRKHRDRWPLLNGLRIPGLTVIDGSAAKQESVPRRTVGHRRLRVRERL